MLRHRLTRYRELGRELGRRGRLARRERLEHVTAVGVGERIEHAPGRVGHTQTRACARSSSAVENSGVDSRTSRRVPSSTSSRVNSTSPSSAQSKTRRSPGSTTRTLARRSSPSSQRKTPSPPSRTSSSTSFANHSSSCSGSVSASQTSSGEAGNTISRVTSIAPPIRNLRVAYTECNLRVAHYQEVIDAADSDGRRARRALRALLRYLLPPAARADRLP